MLIHDCCNCYIEGSAKANERPRENVQIAGNEGHTSVCKTINRDEQTDNEGELLTRQLFPLRRTDRLDFRAAFILSTNVLPFWLFTFSFTFYEMPWCTRFQFICSMKALVEAGVYVKWLFFVPCVYMPLMYACNITEFWRALRHLTRKIQSRASSTNRPASHHRDLN